MATTREHEEFVASARVARAAAAREDAFWREHEATYLKAYPDQFVVVAKDDGRFLGAAPDLAQLRRVLQQYGLDPGRVWVRFLAWTPRRLAL